MYLKLVLLALTIPQITFANEITFFVTSPVKELNWETPRSLALSVSINNIMQSTYPMGHAQVSIKCTSGINQGRVIYAGTTSEDSDEGERLLYKEKIGYGIFLHTFKGRFETQTEILQSINQCDPRRPRNSLGSSKDVVKFKVSEQQCNRAVAFFDNFSKNESAKKFGLSEHPLCPGSGSGNASFVAAFATIADLLSDDIVVSWKRKVFIPHKYIGTKENPVDPYTFLLSGSTTWGTQSSQGHKMEFYDPPLMAAWIRSQPQARRSGKCRIVDVDATQMQRAPAASAAICPEVKKSAKSN